MLTYNQPHQLMVNMHPAWEEWMGTNDGTSETIGCSSREGEQSQWKVHQEHPETHRKASYWDLGREGLLPLGGRGCLLGNRLTEEWKFITEENSQLGVQGWGSASWFCLLFTAQVGTVKCPVSNTYSFSRPHLLWGERRKPPNPKHRGTGWGKRYGKGQTGFRKTQPIPLLFS